MERGYRLRNFELTIIIVPTFIYLRQFIPNAFHSKRGYKLITIEKSKIQTDVFPTSAPTEPSNTQYNPISSSPHRRDHIPVTAHQPDDTLSTNPQFKKLTVLYTDPLINSLHPEARLKKKKKIHTHREAQRNVGHYSHPQNRNKVITIKRDK